MKTRSWLFIAGISLSAPCVSSDYYIGGGIDYLNFDDETNVDEVSVGAVYGIFGNAYNKYLSLEGRAGAGFKDETVKVSGVDFERKLKSYYGLYLKGTLPINELFKPYILIGYSGGEHKILTEYKSQTYSKTSFESSPSYGAGMSVKFEDFSVNFEYINYFNVKDAEISGFGINVIHFFNK